MFLTDINRCWFCQGEKEGEGGEGGEGEGAENASQMEVMEGEEHSDEEQRDFEGNEDENEDL